MSSPWTRKQPDAVAESVLKRAEVSKMARKLQNRLALAQFKAKHGWEDLTLDVLEPRVDEQLKRKRSNSSGDMLSDSSSSASDFQYPRILLSSSPLKAPFYSDAIGSGSSSSGHRKRSYNASFPAPSSNSSARKRFRASPSAGRLGHAGWKDQHQLAQSSPIKPRKQTIFNNPTGSNVSFHRTTSSNMPDEMNPFLSISDDEDDLTPLHSFKIPAVEIRSSPPRTPPPVRGRATLGRKSTGKTPVGKSQGEEGADLLLYLATSPSPANNAARRMHPPSTPPPRNPALPSSMMITPGGSGLLAGFGPHTPSQNFDFAEFVNITPSPAQNAWSRTPGAARTPLTVARRRLTFDTFAPPQSPNTSTKHTGLGMQLGGNLLSS